MKKQMVLKITSFATLLVFIFSLGSMSMAKKVEPDGINWSYIVDCAYSFYATNTTPSNYWIQYSGSTSVGSTRNAYVKATVQKFGDSGSWEDFASVSDEGYAICGAEDDVKLDPGYTYRLKINHKAKTTSGTLLESYTHYSSNNIIVLPN